MDAPLASAAKFSLKNGPKLAIKIIRLDEIIDGDDIAENLLRIADGLTDKKQMEDLLDVVKRMGTPPNDALKARLKDITDKMAVMDPTKRKNLISDLFDNTIEGGIGKNLDKLDVNLVDAWDYLSNLKGRRSNIFKDEKALTIIGQQIKNKDFMDIVGEKTYKDILKTYAGTCKTCDPKLPDQIIFDLLPPDEMLNSLENFTKKFTKDQNIAEVIKDLHNGDLRTQIGGEYILRMFDRKNPYNVSEFEFEYLLPHSKHRADIYIEGPNLKVDGKSWKPKSIASNLLYNGKFPTQLKNYFKNKPFEHSYDYKRFQNSTLGFIDETGKNIKFKDLTPDEVAVYIKKKYQKAFSDREVADDLYNHITDNKKNPLKFEQVFGAVDVDDFLNKVVPDISNSDLYGFIKVR